MSADEGFVYRSGDDAVLDWWQDAEGTMREFYAAAREFAARYDRNPHMLHGWGSSLVGLDPTDADYDSPPDGWRLHRGTERQGDWLTPIRRSNAGKALYAEIEAIRTKGDPRHKLPGWKWEMFRAEPGLFLHDGYVWMHTGTTDGVDVDVWEPVRLSEFYAAREAKDEALGVSL